MAANRKLDWPQVAALAIVVVACVVLAIWLDTEKAESWLALAPAVLGAMTTAYAMTRGQAVETRPHRARRDAETIPPEAP